MSGGERLPIVRPGVGVQGSCIHLQTNHFAVEFQSWDIEFYQYSVCIKAEDNQEIIGKGLGRKIIDKLYTTYSCELAGKDIAYDGEKSLFTIGPLPQNIFEFVVVLEKSSPSCVGGGSPNGSDRKRSRCLNATKVFKVEIKYAATVPLCSIDDALKGMESNNAQNALRVLDIVLRQQQAKRGCLLVRQSYFSDNGHNLVPLGGGVSALKGLHTSFRTTQSGLSLNINVSTTLVVKAGPVIDFLIANQNVRDARQIDWMKAKRMLKSMRIKTKHTKMEFKISGLSELPCIQQVFSLKLRNDNAEEQTKEITVYDYYNEKNIQLTLSAYFPCLDVGRPNQPIYLPLELCDLVPLQRYTKSLSSQQRTALVEKSRQTPQERMRVISDALLTNKYENEPMLVSCGISLDKQFMKVNGRVLNAPTLKVGNAVSCIPRDGRWNFNNKTFYTPIGINSWAIVNFSARCDMSHLSRELINCGTKKGITFARPITLINEEPQWRKAGPNERVQRMFQKISQLTQYQQHKLQFLLCVLPERKNCDIYGPWKKKNLHEEGIFTQCVAPVKLSDHYLSNVLLKINTKLGGTNSLLTVELNKNIPLISETPTLILGMDVSHGSPGTSDIPSIAAVVGSRCWPLISRYKACVRSQSPKSELIDSLYKPLSDEQDAGVMRELLLEFYRTSNQHKPRQIIIFRDGVSESQFNQVLNIELQQIIKAIERLGIDYLPKFTVIVAQKNHHTRLNTGSLENVPAGTIVDTGVVHPRNYDFFMCAHAGPIGMSRPTHYHVLLDEIGFSPDDLQMMIHAFSYVYQRSTTAISIVAPIAYAHLAAAQIAQFIKTDIPTESVTTTDTAHFPVLPRLHKNVENSMFFC